MRQSSRFFLFQILSLVSSCSHRCSVMMMMIVRRFDGRYLNLCNNFLEINIIVTLSCSYALFTIISCVYLTFTLGRGVKSCKKWIFPSSFPVLMLIVDACLRWCVLIFSSFRVTFFWLACFSFGAVYDFHSNFTAKRSTKDMCCGHLTCVRGFTFNFTIATVELEWQQLVKMHLKWNPLIKHKEMCQKN